MSAADVRTVYDGFITFNVTAPGNGSAYASIASLLTQAQLAELSANGRTTQRLEMFAATAFNFENGTPGNPTVIDPNANPQAVLANQKPNEAITCPTTEQTVYVRSANSSTVTVQCTFYYVNDVR
jgi:hypothetical protein